MKDVFYLYGGQEQACFGGIDVVIKKIKVKTVLILFCVAACCLFAAGCKNDKQDESEYDIYYLNQDMNAIVSVGYEPEAAEDATNAMIEEVLQKIEAGTDSVEYQKVYPDMVEIERYEYVGSQLYLYFNSAYSEMPVAQEVLCRGAIVRNMIQIKGISGVSFFVDDLPLTDANGREVGIMTNESFADNPGEEINNIQVADLTLYFASLDGQSLVSETQHVHYYSSNISTEKLVMEQLLEGPKSENAQSAIPAGTGLISVSVMDGVCFVNLDENFLAQDFSIREDVVIYSIVNSLAELSTVDTVQLSVNGETNQVYRQDMSLKEYYTFNLDLISEEGEDVDVDQQKQQEKEGIIDTGE